MFTKLIAIDNQKIGTVHFHACIVKLEAEEVGFAIFMDEQRSPLLYFSKEGPERVNFKIDNEQFLVIVKNSKFSRAERKKLYDDFEFFLRAMEQRATVYLFKHAEVRYISNSRDIIRYKNYYISASIEELEKS